MRIVVCVNKYAYVGHKAAKAFHGLEHNDLKYFILYHEQLFTKLFCNQNRWDSVIADRCRCQSLPTDSSRGFVVFTKDYRVSPSVGKKAFLVPLKRLQFYINIRL